MGFWWSVNVPVFIFWVPTECSSSGHKQIYGLFRVKLSERIEAIPSACASQSQHLPAGDNWHLKSLFFLPAQRSVLLLLLLPHSSEAQRLSIVRIRGDFPKKTK